MYSERYSKKGRRSVPTPDLWRPNVETASGLSGGSLGDEGVSSSAQIYRAGSGFSPPKSEDRLLHNEREEGLCSR
jgi:hypothetical protein